MADYRLHAHPVAVLEMFLVVGFHPELEAVLVLDPAHEGEIPGKMKNMS